MGIPGYAEHWTEPRPAASEMTDTEVLDWIGAHCDQAAWCKATDEHAGGFVIYSEDIPGRPTKGATIREAVQLADARLKQGNQ